MGDNRPINGSYTTYFILKNEAYSNRPISRVIKLVVYKYNEFHWQAQMPGEADCSTPSQK